MDYTRGFLLFCLSALMLLGASIAATETEAETNPEPSPVQLLEAGETAQSEAGDENVRKVRQFFGPPPPFFGPPPPPFYGGYGGYGGGFGGGYGGGFQRTRVITRTRYRGRGGYYGGGFYG